MKNLIFYKAFYLSNDTNGVSHPQLSRKGRIMSLKEYFTGLKNQDNWNDIFILHACGLSVHKEAH